MRSAAALIVVRALRAFSRSIGRKQHRRTNGPMTNLRMFDGLDTNASRQRRSTHHCTMGSKLERWLLTNRYSVSVGTFSRPVTWIFTRQSARIHPSSAMVSAW